MSSALLRDDDGHRVGVLQAINKSDGKPIQEADEVKIDLKNSVNRDSFGIRLL
mgnify:CR=1 FL=1